MIVRLTTRQEQLMLAIVGRLDSDFMEALTLDRRQAGARVDVNAPFAAWVAVREALVDAAFNERGYKRQGVPVALQKALASVHQATGHAWRHPALRGAGCLGHHPIIIHAWQMDQPDRQGRLFHPYPQPGRPFVILKPTWQTVPGGGRLTTWGPDGISPNDEPLQLEEIHLRLWREPISALCPWDVEVDLG